MARHGGRALALILGRAGSKGVPGKNTREVAGRPCAAWTLDDAIAAREGGEVARVAVSTDDPRLRAMALECGAEVVDRPQDLAHDRATIDDAARHAVRALEDAALDPVVILYANVPVRPEGLIGRAVRLLVETGADSVQSYAPVGKHHPWWTAVVEESAGGTVRPWEGEVLNHGVFRRQDLPPAHVPDGGVLAVRRAALLLEVPGVTPGPHAFFGRDRRGLINPAGSVVDIDDEVDLIVAGVLLGLRAGGGA